MDTPLDRLCALFGSAKTLAAGIGVHPSIITRWRKAVDHPARPAWTGRADGRGGQPGAFRTYGGRVPPEYNVRVMDAARKAKLPADAVNACLDLHICPCCKRPMDGGQPLPMEG